MFHWALSAVLRKRWQRILNDQTNPVAAQERAYQRLRQGLSGTVVSDRFGLSALSSYKIFARMGEPKKYEDFEDLILSSLSGKDHGLLFYDNVDFVGLSSGTTSNSKSILYNRAMVKAFTSFQMSLSAIVEKHTSVRMLRDRRITWGSTAILETTETGIPKGYISGFLSARAPWLIERLGYPRRDTALVLDMNEKIERLASEAKGADIRLIAGVPTYIINLLERLKETWNVGNFSEVWPKVSTMVYSAMSIDNYRAQVDQMMGRPLKYIGCYAATEGPLGYEIPLLSGDKSGTYSFHFGDLVYTFRRIDHKGPMLSVGELREGDEVEVYISSPNGLLYYELSDCLRITRTQPTILFEIMGRVGHGLNVATEKSSLSQLNQAVLRMKNKMGIPVSHYCAYPGRSLKDRPCYEWVIFTDSVNWDNEQMARALDDAMMELNGDYREARLETHFLEAPRVYLESAELSRTYFARDSHRGQLKMKTAFDTREKFESFMRELNPEFRAERRSA